MSGDTTHVKCLYLPEDCHIEGCQNWCRRRKGWAHERPPLFAHNRMWSQDEQGAKEYEAFRLACPHDDIWVEHGCDGIFAWEKKHCSKCGLMLSRDCQQVWGDACV